MKDFYPALVDESDELKVKQGHGVKPLGFRNLGRNFEFSVHSPSVPIYRERKYLLDYHKNGENSGENIKPDNFAGLLGESIMRIVVSEFFRRVQRKQLLKDIGFIKTDLNPYEDNRIIRENDEYRLLGISRYNQIVLDKTIPEMYCQTEYDGLFTYTAGRTKGLIICESKVGNLGYLKAKENGQEEIYRKIIKPIKSLFPDRQLDFLLMGARDELQQKKKYKPLKTGVKKLNEYLNEHDIGFIPFFLPVTRRRIDMIASTILYLNKTNNLEPHLAPSDTRYIVDGQYALFVKGKRVEHIIKRVKPTRYEVIYESENSQFAKMHNGSEQINAQSTYPKTRAASSTQ